jgi:hypothetical protein
MGITDKVEEKADAGPGPEFETKTGKNESITEDVRERAMKSVSGGDSKPVTVTKTKTSVTAPKSKLPMPDYSNEDLDKMGLNEDLKPKKKPYIDIPDKSSIGVRQFKSDATSPIGRMFKKLYGKGMKAGGSVSSASKRADGIATKGKTRGKMC